MASARDGSKMGVSAGWEQGVVEERESCARDGSKQGLGAMRPRDGRNGEPKG